MSQAAVATSCAHGHKAERTISAFAMTRAGDSDMFGAEIPAGGGCCGGGGGCACGSQN